MVPNFMRNQGNSNCNSEVTRTSASSQDGVKVGFTLSHAITKNNR